MEIIGLTPGFYYHMHFFTMRPEDAVGGFICVDIIKKRLQKLQSLLWSFKGLNLGLPDYESGALTN